MTGPRPRLDSWAIARLATALVSFLPFAYGLVAGGAFYFRDLSSYFFPIRRFVVEGLRHGEVRRFNPYVNEGIPVVLPPVAYPLDLLQALVPNEWGFSLLLALHVPLAALGFLYLGRTLGLRPSAAALGALAYALSGFSLSCVNLYIHVEALAWAPLVIALLLRASAGGARETAMAGAALAVCLSTTGVEIAGQAVACAFVLGASRRVRDQLRFGFAVLLGFALAAAPLVSLARLVSGSRRDAGFSVAESLDHSVHPVSLLQTLVAGLFGDPVASGYSYWGAAFWGGPSPYFLSLYLGGGVVCLAAIGALGAERHRGRLLLLLAAALLVCLGRFARLDVVLELAPFLTRFRFPVKAFFTVLVASSLLSGLGAEQLARSRQAWRPFAVLSALVGLGLLSLSLLEPALPSVFGWLEGRFFVEAYPQALRGAALRAVAGDAAGGALALLALAGIAALALRLRLSLEAAVVAVTALVAADLLRAGAGLNPTAHASLYTFSPEMTRVAERLRESGGRVFTCTIHAMPTFREAVRHVPRAAVWTTAVWRESLSPYANMDLGLPTTGADATALVSADRSLSTGDAMCRDAGTLQRLREGGVRFILSVQPFDNPELRLVDVAAPARTAPLAIHVYELERSLPDPALWETPDDLDGARRGRVLEGTRARYLETAASRVRLAAWSPSAAYLILRRTHAPGWSATVNGRPAAIVPANGRHQAIAVPAGESEVVLRYAAAGGWAGTAVSLLAAAVAGVLWLRGRPAAA